RINNRNTLTADWNHMRWNSIHGIQSATIVSRGKASWGDDFVDVDTGNLKLLSSINSNFSNEFRTSIGREHQYENSNPGAPGEPTTGPNGRPPQIGITGPGGTFTIGKPQFLERKALPLEDRHQFADTASYTHDKH